VDLPPPFDRMQFPESMMMSVMRTVGSSAALPAGRALRQRRRRQPSKARVRTDELDSTVRRKVQRDIVAAAPKATPKTVCHTSMLLALASHHEHTCVACVFESLHARSHLRSLDSRRVPVHGKP
jgi:hypothetical protein